MCVNEDRNLGKTNTAEMCINKGMHEPIKKHLYDTPLKQRKIVDEMMNAGIIKRS